MRPTSIASLAALSLAAARAPAQPPPVPPGMTPARAHLSASLDFSVADDVKTCPGEGVLHDEIARRLGYDPFARGADGSPFGAVRVVVARVGPGLVATYEHRDPSGVLSWSRTYEVPGSDRESCDLVITALGTFLAIELSSFARRLPSPTPSSPSPGPAPTLAKPLAPLDSVPLPKPIPPPKPASRGRFEIGLGVFFGGGAGPGGAVVGAIHMGVAAAPRMEGENRLLLAVEGRVHAPSADRDGVRTQLFAGSVLACFNRDLVTRAPITWGGIVCAIGTMGSLHGSWQNEHERASLARTGLYAAAGGRLGMEARFASVVAIRAEVDVTPALRAAQLVLPGRATASGAGAVAGSAGLSFVWIP